MLLLLLHKNRLFNTNDQGLCPPEYFKECLKTLVYPFRFIQSASITRLDHTSSSNDEKPSVKGERVEETFPPMRHLVGETHQAEVGLNFVLKSQCDTHR